MRYIILLLLICSGLSAQTKWRQIERSNIKWQVPAAFDSIPGSTGYASKYIGLQTLVDTLGIEFPSDIDSLTYRNDTLFLYIGSGYYFTIIETGGGPFGSSDDGNVAYWRADTLAGDTAHYWDRTNKRLGLNTKTPESLLHVKKNEFALPVAEFDNPGTNGKTVLIKHGSSTDGRYPLQITTPAGSSYFDARGYLGLGVSPSYPLHVKNASGISRFENTNSNGDAGFDLYNANKNWRVAMNAEGGSTNNLFFRDVTGSRYPLTILSSNGYVGILNITPGRELDVTGRVRVSTLDTDGSAPGTNGTTKMVITDGNGDLSFANIPSGGGIDSTILIGGWGIEAVESPANTWNLVADTTQVATQFDLSQKNTDLTLSGTTTVTINSSTGSDVTLTQGSNVTFTRSGNDLTIASTGGGGIDSTSLVGGWGVNVSESPANTWNVSADTAEVATQFDISGKTNGSGTTNYISKFTNSNTIGNSQLQDNGSTVGLGIAPNASYKFNVGSGNMKIGDASTSSTMNKLYFGDGTFVYVGEDVADDRLYLRGSSLSIQTGGSLGANGNVLTSNGTTASWVTPAATSLSYLGTGSPITLQPSGGGSNVRFLAGSNITLSRSGTDMTISAAGGGGVPGTGAAGQVTFWTAPSGVPTLSGSSSFFWDNGNVRLGLGTAAPTRLLDVNGSVRFRSVIYDSNNSGGNIGQNLASNGIGAWYWQEDGIWNHGQLSRSSGTTTAINSTDTKITFDSQIQNGGITTSTADETITVTQAGTYEVNLGINITGASTRNISVNMYKNATSGQNFGMTDYHDGENTYITMTKIISFNANDVIDMRIAYGTGTGTDVSYYYPIFTIKRLK
jgi:hypothetical protein